MSLSPLTRAWIFNSSKSMCEAAISNRKHMPIMLESLAGKINNADIKLEHSNLSSKTRKKIESKISKYESFVKNLKLVKSLDRRADLVRYVKENNIPRAGLLRL